MEWWSDLDRLGKVLTVLAVAGVFAVIAYVAYNEVTACDADICSEEEAYACGYTMGRWEEYTGRYPDYVAYSLVHYNLYWVRPFLTDGDPYVVFANGDYGDAYLEGRRLGRHNEGINHASEYIPPTYDHLARCRPTEVVLYP